jgi:phenylpyruvate tautomerase PptA (4-oxalocrotonate tautomerase family)
MPALDLTIPAGTFTPEQQTALVDELTTVMLSAEGAPNTDFFRSITCVMVHEASIYPSGRPVTEPVFRLVASVPAGALSDRRKGVLVTEATRAISAAAGLGESDGLRVWVIVNEVPEYPSPPARAAGDIVHFEQLRQIAERERDGQAAPAGV